MYLDTLASTDLANQSSFKAFGALIQKRRIINSIFSFGLMHLGSNHLVSLFANELTILFNKTKLAADVRALFY